MLVHVDREADAIYLELSKEPIESSEEVFDGIILDYTADGQRRKQKNKKKKYNRKERKHKN
jgi:hypothetical protein